MKTWSLSKDNIKKKASLFAFFFMLSLLKLHVFISRHYEQLWHRSKLHFAANRKLCMETLSERTQPTQNHCFSNFQKMAPAAAVRPSTLYTLHSRKKNCLLLLLLLLLHYRHERLAGVIAWYLRLQLLELRFTLFLFFSKVLICPRTDRIKFQLFFLMKRPPKNHHFRTLISRTHQRVSEFFLHALWE